ncbi:MAG: leucine--tRNA ligase [Tildeniella nuda ZEHNDER 1965/U140]|nr:leucine--tRNA ligase [Tildeniella nuda ZEHNDER 1965/U140]
MGVPAHDVRDFKFAKEQGLAIQAVVREAEEDKGAGGAGGRGQKAEGKGGELGVGSRESGVESSPTPHTLHPTPLTQAYTEPGVLINSGAFDGLPSVEAKTAIVQYAEQQGFGKARIQYRLRDWLISRQRYWGAPIPIIHCPTCGAVPVPDADLPVQLPENVELSGRGGSPLATLSSWVNVPCPTCGTAARRETDTMDTFIDSSWYFLRYPDARDSQQVFDPAKTNDWMPVDQYVGGIEHAILHLLYSRFFTKVLRDRGLLNFDEPFQRLLTQGMVQGKTYKNPRTGKYVISTQIADLTHPIDPETGDPLELVYEKMSKSKYNGVAPGDVIDKYGADTARMFILFKAPPEKDLEWDEADVEGQSRFLNRVWRLVMEFGEQRSAVSGQRSAVSKPEKELRRSIHTAIAAITDDLEGDYQFNTAVSELMKLSNALTDASCNESPVYAEGIQTLLILLAPFAPHIAEALWHGLGHTDSIHVQSWLTADPAALVADEMTLVIQILGKTRGTLQVPSQSSKDELEQYARESEIARKYIDGKEIKKVIVVPGKLVNFVVG